MKSIREYLEDVAKKQKAIDDTELAEVKKDRDAYYDELLKLRAEKVEWIEKACEWLKAYDITFTQTPSMLEDFKKAMEEV